MAQRKAKKPDLKKVVSMFPPDLCSELDKEVYVDGGTRGQVVRKIVSNHYRLHKRRKAGQ